MKDKCILTAESVTEGHPDKLCDTIADAVLDACLKNDPAARVACEVMATAGKIVVAGEITAAELPDIPAIVCRTVREAGYGDCQYEVEVITHDQSGDIAGAVRTGAQTGAGDQGIMYGYACNETDALLPLPVVLANQLTRLLTNARKTGRIPGLKPDGKAQVSVEYEFGLPSRIAAVVVSCQHEVDKDPAQLRREVMEHVITPALREFPADVGTHILINPSGRFVEGGFEADTGLTGRKLMVDTYGGLAPHGGGALSGKDATKVDRSGAYMARYIAKNIVAAGLAEKCTVSLAYAIGKAEPVAVNILRESNRSPAKRVRLGEEEQGSGRSFRRQAETEQSGLCSDEDTHLTGEYSDMALERAVGAVFDLTPAGIICDLGLDRPIFAGHCNYGHFSHPDAPWERTDRTGALTKACAMAEKGVFAR